MQYIIIGGGPAGATAALELRGLDPKGEVLIISNEDYQFYKRSKILSFVSASCSEDDLFLKGKTLYDEHNISFIHGHVKSVLPNSKQVLLRNGKKLSYDFLLIASGGSPLVLPWEGVNLEGVSTLYNLDDAKKVVEQACDAENVVVIGGGSIAMKAIQNFKKMGLNISIVEKASHLWPIGFDRKVARIVEKRIKENGIQIYLNEEVADFRGDSDKLTHVMLKSGIEIPADIALITIGTNPNVDFLKDTYIKVDKGVIVDSNLRTTIPSIFAAGDVAQIYDPLYNIPMLHATWGNAKKQGRIAAINMTGGNLVYKGTIPIQTIRIFGFVAIAVGITHSKKNFDEISWISFEKRQCRKFVVRNNKLIGVLVLGEEIDKNILKPLLKNAVSKQVDIGHFNNLLIEENLDFETLFAEI
ncbi:MAG: NAD(P)/FAD-dependent oxidoreductase [Promethearchaeota archaeon]|jgi:NADPH-dependent 2,4-dienoyl-CoA reductase/sulfur reductase-like enzyme